MLTLGHTHAVELADPPRRLHGCCLDGISFALPPSEAYPAGAVAYIPRGAKEASLVLERCPLCNPHPKTAIYLEIGILHATDRRILDIERSSETDVRLVLLVSALQQKMPGGLGGLC